MAVDIVAVSREVTGLIAYTPGKFMNFFYGPESVFNATAEKQNFPINYMAYPVVIEDEPMQSGGAFETYQLDYFFFDYVPNLDGQIEEDHRTIINSMKARAREFRLRMEQRPEIDEVKKSKRIEVIHKADANMSGIWLHLEVVVMNTDPICLPEP